MLIYHLIMASGSGSGRCYLLYIYKPFLSLAGG